MSVIEGRSKKDITAIAEARGLVCILPLTCELLLDIDDAFDADWTFPISDPVLTALAENEIDVRLPMLSVESPGGNTHVYIRLDRDIPDDGVRIALQAALGSDPVRETLSALRCDVGSDAATVLFELPDIAERVLAWRSLFNPL